MPLYRKYKQGDLTVAVWKVDETVEQLRSMFHQFSIYEAGYARFSAEKRKQEWLAVRVLLKEILGEEKEIAYHPSGKPFLKDNSLHISFSHTHGYVAVALHPSAEVGVDIEQYGTRVQRVASRFIREDEKISIESGDEIYALLSQLNLAIYTPSVFILPSCIDKYITSEEGYSGLTVRGRESGIRQLMSINLLKRLESSVNSFRLSLNRILGFISATVAKINSLKNRGDKTSTYVDNYDFEGLDLDEQEDIFIGGKKTQIALEDNVDVFIEEI